MKKTFQGTLLLTTMLLGAQLNANEIITDSSTQWSIGVGSYAFSISNGDNTNDSLDFGGINITTGYSVNNNLQFRGTYFSLENTDFSEIESKGFDLMVYGGTGLSEPGFRGYGGGGFFSDKWSLASDSETSSGLQLGGGLGYNWGSAALDFVLTLRQADKYEDFIDDSGTYIAVSGNLTISYLF